MTANELEEIRAVLRRVRDERFPHVEFEFLEAVLQAQAEAGEDALYAEKAIKAAADKVLAQRSAS